MAKIVLTLVVLSAFFLQSCASFDKAGAPPKPIVVGRPVDKDVVVRPPVNRVAKVARKSFLGMFPRSRDLVDQLSSVVKGFNHAPFIAGTGPHDLPAPNQSFIVSFEKVKENAGPLKRYSVFLKPDIGSPRQIGQVIGWVAISPNSKYVVREPLALLNVANGEESNISAELGVEGFINIHFWSPDGKSFIVSQTDCAFNCAKNDIIQYWRIDLL